MTLETGPIQPPAFHHTLGVTAMQLVHTGQVMLEQQLHKIEQIFEDLDESQQNVLSGQLDEASLLFQLDYGNKKAVSNAITKINVWLAKSADLLEELHPIKEGVSDFKVYLELVEVFNHALTQKSSNVSEIIATLENNLKPIVRASRLIIEQNPLLKASLRNLVQCLQEMKLAKIQPRLSEEAPTKRDKTRFDMWRLGLQAFKLNTTSHKVMTGPWLKSTLDAHLKKTGTHFVNADFTVNEQGINRFNTIMTATFSSHPEPLNQDDLALLSILFDIKAMEKVMDRYGLKGDGSSQFPFTTNNLKALLLGLGANLNAHEMKRLHPKALEIIQQLKTNFKSGTELAQSEMLKALKLEFEQEKQNKVPNNVKNLLGKILYTKLHTFLGKLRSYVLNNVIGFINIIDSEWIKNYGPKFFDQFKPVNQPLHHLSKDIYLLEANAKIDKYIIDTPTQAQSEKKLKTLFTDLYKNTARAFCLHHKEFHFSESEIRALKVYKDLQRKGANGEDFLAVSEKVKNIFCTKINPWDHYVDEIIADLKNLSFDRFIQKYPAFKQENMPQAEYHQLQLFAANSSRAHSAIEQQDIRRLVLGKLTAIYPYARSALFSHILAYNSALYETSKQDLTFRLPLESGQGASFALKPVIHDEQGLALSMFSPVEKSLAGDTIPLILMLEGSHDLLSFLRDLHPLGAGMGEFSAQMPYLERILKAVNQEVETLTKKYPHKKVSIEIFGHSLGGADTYQLLLALQEAMAQNKARTASGHQDYVDLIDPKNQGGFRHAKNPDLRSELPQALEESLGLRKRDFGHGSIDDRKLSPESISAINLSNIANIKAYAKNGAGCHQKILSAIAATAAFLGKNSDYRLYDNPLDLSGDAVQRTAHGRGLYLADQHESFFNDIIKLAHCKFNTLKEGLLNQGKYLLDGRLAPIEVHQEKVFDQGPLSWLQKDAKIVKNDSKKNMKYLQEELRNPVKLYGENALVDMWAYRRLKAMIYFTLTLTATVIYPVLNISRLWLEMIEKRMAQLFGVVSPKPERETALHEVKEKLLAKQEQLLFSSMPRTNTSWPISKTAPTSVIEPSKHDYKPLKCK